MPMVRTRRAVAFATVIVAMLVWASAGARADWITYRGDPGRSGIDSSSVGMLPFSPAWTSPNLGGAIWAQPLVHNGLVIVATESNQVFALRESTGQLVWQASTGTPVPSEQLSCGDISPTVGVTSTPVIDPATNKVFVVADTLDGSTILHKLFAFNLANGTPGPGFPVSVEPPGDVPKDQLQRPGLALDNARIIIGYGGNDGDCGTYHGWLVSVPESGGPLQSFEVDQSGSQGAIWGAGNAPPIDSAGDVWVATGNGNSSAYDFQESVLKLDVNMNLLDHWAPSDWQALDASDADIGSSEPVLLPNGLVFEIGKQGIGYLLSAASLRGTGGGSVYQASVCSGSWGGAIYYSGIIYVTCSDGLYALSLNAAAGTFSPLAGWQVPTSANGPPIVAGGLVWATDWNDGTLYGLNLHTGQPAVTQTSPRMEHFTTPSASDGKLFLATGQTVEAFTIANPVSPPAPPAPPASPAPPTAPTRCVLRLHSNRVKILHPKRPKHSKHAPPAFGALTLIAQCDQSVRASLSGIVTELLGNRPKHGKRKTRTVHLATMRTTLVARAARPLQIRIAPSLLLALEHRIPEAGTFTLTATNGRGEAQATVRATKLRL